MMYLLVFIHLGHNIRFSPARCVKSLLPTPQLSLLPLQWEKWRQYQHKCRCLSEITPSSIAQCISHTAAIVLSETFILIKKNIYIYCLQCVTVPIMRTSLASGLQWAAGEANQEENNQYHINNTIRLDSSLCRFGTMFVDRKKHIWGTLKICGKLRIYSH